MTPYYQDDHVTLYHGDAFEVIPSLPEDIGCLLTDPPYFQVKDDEWDNQWDKASDFLAWMGEWLDLAKPKLAANGSVWVFASPAMTSSVERLVGERFRVLNSIRWMKPNGWHERNHLPSLRRFLTPWEGIVLAEHREDTYAEPDMALRREVFAPLRAYLMGEWERAGWKPGNLGEALGYNSRLPTRWTDGSFLPTPETYERMRALLNRDGGSFLPLEYEDLRAEFGRLKATFEHQRRPFVVTDRAMGTDVWNFQAVRPYPGKHPCDKR